MHCVKAFENINEAIEHNGHSPRCSACAVNPGTPWVVVQMQSPTHPPDKTCPAAFLLFQLSRTCYWTFYQSSCGSSPGAACRPPPHSSRSGCFKCSTASVVSFSTPRASHAPHAEPLRLRLRFSGFLTGPLGADPPASPTMAAAAWPALLHPLLAHFTCAASPPRLPPVSARMSPRSHAVWSKAFAHALEALLASHERGGCDALQAGLNELLALFHVRRRGIR
jgi:hypothetical protein